MSNIHLVDSWEITWPKGAGVSRGGAIVYTADAAATFGVDTPGRRVEYVQRRRVCVSDRADEEANGCYMCDRGIPLAGTDHAHLPALECHHIGAECCDSCHWSRRD